MGLTELTLNKTCRARQELWKRWKELISKVCRGSNASVCPPPHHLSSLNNVNGSHKERCRWGPTQGAAHAASSDNTMVIRLAGERVWGKIKYEGDPPIFWGKLGDYSSWTDKKRTGITTARNTTQRNWKMHANRLDCCVVFLPPAPEGWRNLGEGMETYGVAFFFFCTSSAGSFSFPVSLFFPPLQFV